MKHRTQSHRSRLQLDDCTPYRSHFEYQMKPCIQLKLFATLQTFAGGETEHYPIEAGMTVRKLLQQLNIPEEKARLIFIDGVKAGLSAVLSGGERVGIFPPIGGG